MIISASRRTDIPAFYADWMMNRILRGRSSPCRIHLTANRSREFHSCRADVEVIVFWTRNPKPLMRYLSEMDSLGLRYYFQFSILGYPREIDPKCPPLETAVQVFQELADHIGPCRIVWRTIRSCSACGRRRITTNEDSLEIAAELTGHTNRAVIGVVDDYRNRSPEGRGIGESDHYRRLPSPLRSLARALRSAVH